MIKVGSRVRYIREDGEFDKATGFYPPIGTLGTVKTVSGDSCQVKWDEGTYGEGIWWCKLTAVEEAFKMKFDINDYKDKYVMHCKTEEEAKDFCEYLHSVGREWCTGASYLNNISWYPYGNNTAYAFNEGCYSDVSWYRDNGYKILKWSDFTKEFTKADLKTGDIVKFREGELGIVILELNTIACKNGGWISMTGISEDLISSFYLGKYDIIAVRRPTESCDCCFDAMRGNAPRGKLVYERKEVEEMTLAEVCKLLGKEIKIVK